MKKYFSLLILAAFFSLTLLESGCASTASANNSSKQTVEERLAKAEAKKECIQKKLNNIKNVNEGVELKAALSEVQKEIDNLKSGKVVARVNQDAVDEEDGFQSTKERKIIYGPVGAVLHLTEWILVKLYILN
jgi:esterase/lipase